MAMVEYHDSDTAFVLVDPYNGFLGEGDKLLRLATEISGRYMSRDRAEEPGKRNAVPGDLLVRVAPGRVIADGDVAGYAAP